MNTRTHFELQCDLYSILFYSAGTKINLRQQKNKRVYAEGLTRVIVQSPKDVEHVMSIGAKSRSVGAHDFNAHSSRSHLVMTVTIIASSTRDQEEDEEGNGSPGSGGRSKTAWGEPPPTSSNKQRVSRLHMIDLAGSERISKTAATGDRLREARKFILYIYIICGHIYIYVWWTLVFGRLSFH
jgi:hypothetical protein